MSKLSRSLMSIMAIGGLMSMELNGELGRNRRKHLKPQEPKRIGYVHKERTPEEKRAKYLHKLKIKERRKRKGSMKGNYESRNGNLIVKIIENTAVNDNGTFIKGSETRGKRDIVMAQVLVGDSNIANGSIIYFSFYAGQPFTLEGEEVYVVNKLDIKFIKKGEL